MAMSARVPRGSFGDFLNASKRYDRDDHTVALSQARRQSPGADLLRLLQPLADAGEEGHPEGVFLTDLARRSEMGYDTFSRTMILLQEIQLLAIDGAPGEEVATITPAGKQVLALLH